MKSLLFSVSLITLLAASAASAQPMPGQVVPRNDPNGVYCREYTQPVIVGGRKVSSYGTACQQPDGSWKIINNNTQEQAESEEIEVLGPPEYVSAPRYVAPPVEYYEMAPPPPPYYRPYPYPYGSGMVIEFSNGWHRGGYGYGGGHHWH